MRKKSATLDWEFVRQEIEKGRTDLEISRDLKTSIQAIRYIRTRLASGKQKKVRRQGWDEIADLYGQGYHSSDIAKMTQSNTDGVLYALRAMGYLPKKKPPKPEKQTKVREALGDRAEEALRFLLFTVRVWDTIPPHIPKRALRERRANLFWAVSKAWRDGIYQGGE